MNNSLYIIVVRNECSRINTVTNLNFVNISAVYGLSSAQKKVEELFEKYSEEFGYNEMPDREIDIVSDIEKSVSSEQDESTLYVTAIKTPDKVSEDLKEIYVVTAYINSDDITYSELVGFGETPEEAEEYKNRKIEEILKENPSIDKNYDCDDDSNYDGSITLWNCKHGNSIYYIKTTKVEIDKKQNNMKISENDFVNDGYPSYPQRIDEEETVNKSESKDSEDEEEDLWEEFCEDSYEEDAEDEWYDDEEEDYDWEDESEDDYFSYPTRIDEEEPALDPHKHYTFEELPDDIQTQVIQKSDKLFKGISYYFQNMFRKKLETFAAMFGITPEDYTFHYDERNLAITTKIGNMKYVPISLNETVEIIRTISDEPVTKIFHKTLADLSILTTEIPKPIFIMKLFNDIAEKVNIMLFDLGHAHILRSFLNKKMKYDFLSPDQIKFDYKGNYLYIKD